jgi:hypothetical protein
LIEVTAELGIGVIDVIIQRTYLSPLIRGKLKVVHHVDETKRNKTEKMMAYLRSYARSVIGEFEHHYCTSVLS